MKEYNYNREIWYNLAFFEAVMDDTNVIRHDYGEDGGTPKKSIPVKYIYGPKSRILSDLANTTDSIRLPAVAITMNSTSRDNDRIKKKGAFLYKAKDGSYQTLEAIPFNINVTMTVIGKYQEDVDQIITNFAVLCNPYAIFEWREPKTGNSVESEIYWSGEISYDYPTDVAVNAKWKLEASTSFTIKTYLYRTASKNVPTICTINTNVVPVNSFYCNYDTMLEKYKDVPQDKYTSLGRPQLKFTDRSFFRVGDKPRIKLQGEGFQSMKNVYLSADNLEMFPHREYIIDDEKIMAYQVPSFTTKGTVELFVDVPLLSSDGLFNVIATNNCGKGDLISDSTSIKIVADNLPFPIYIHKPYHHGITVSPISSINALIEYNEEIGIANISDMINDVLLATNFTTEDLITHHYAWFTPDIYEDFIAYQNAMLSVTHMCQSDDQLNSDALN